jgi:hypothetical protein
MKFGPPKLPPRHDAPVQHAQPYTEDDARNGRASSTRHHAAHNGSKVALTKPLARREEFLLRCGGQERSADGIFFEQLIAPLERDAEPQDSGPHSQAFMSTHDASNTAEDPPLGWSSLLEEVAKRMPLGADQSLQATLFMPTLGRIGINARHRAPKGWDLSLDCIEVDTANRLRQHHSQCQDDLSRALCQSVTLSVRHRGCA